MEYTYGFCNDKAPGLIYIGREMKKAVCQNCYTLDLERQAVEHPYSKLAKKLGSFLFGFDYYRKMA